MSIKIQGTTVVDDSRQLQNVREYIDICQLDAVVNIMVAGTIWIIKKRNLWRRKNNEKRD